MNLNIVKYFIVTILFLISCKHEDIRNENSNHTSSITRKLKINGSAVDSTSCLLIVERINGEIDSVPLGIVCTIGEIEQIGDSLIGVTTYFNNWKEGVVFKHCRDSVSNVYSKKWSRIYNSNMNYDTDKFIVRRDSALTNCDSTYSKYENIDSVKIKIVYSYGTWCPYYISNGKNIYNDMRRSIGQRLPDSLLMYESSFYSNEQRKAINIWVKGNHARSFCWQNMRYCESESDYKKWKLYASSNLSGTSKLKLLN